MLELYHWFDLIGVAVFAISGTLLAREKNMDGFGVVVLASVTAIGGGTLRDVILNVPVFWLHDQGYFITILVTAIFTILWLNFKADFPHFILQLADALGLAFFAVMGMQKALNLGMPDLTAIVMGTITGCFGGVIRDVLAREIPMLLKGELYAITCIAGGIVLTQSLNLGVSTGMAMVSGGVTILLLRLAAIRWKLGLHVFRYID